MVQVLKGTFTWGAGEMDRTVANLIYRLLQEWDREREDSRDEVSLLTVEYV